MRAGFIGAGKVGFTLGKYLAMHGIEISGYYSRTPASAKEAAEFTQSRYYTSIEEITKDSDTLFLTVPDGTIGEIWDDMRNLPIKNKNICHCNSVNYHILYIYIFLQEKVKKKSEQKGLSLKGIIWYGYVYGG